MGGCISRPKKPPSDISISDKPILRPTFNGNYLNQHVTNSKFEALSNKQRNSVLGTQLPPLPPNASSTGTSRSVTPAHMTAIQQQQSAAAAARISAAVAAAAMASGIAHPRQWSCHGHSNGSSRTSSPQHVVYSPQAQHPLHQVVTKKGSVQSLDLHDIHAHLRDSPIHPPQQQPHMCDSPSHSSLSSSRKSSLQRKLFMAVFSYSARTVEEVSVQRGDRLLLLNQS